MRGTARHPENPPEAPNTDRRSERQRHASVEPETLLALLGDEYTYRVFRAVVEQPRTGRELVEAADVSKATVYRRLDRLEEAGLVGSTMRIATDGNHCKQFHTTARSLEVTFDESGFDASIRRDRRNNGRPAGQPADD